MNSWDFETSSMDNDLYMSYIYVQSIEEMCRVSKEVRIFPLLTVDAERSTYVEPIIDILRAKKKDVKEIKVAYEFQKGGNTMLKIS